jgi:hypothetical protein
MKDRETDRACGTYREKRNVKKGAVWKILGIEGGKYNES